VTEPSLFDVSGSHRPLADRMRPKTLAEFLGQEHLLGPGKPLRQAIERGEVPSIVFWGPPGSGKTTLAFLIAQYTNKHFEPFSAVTEGVGRVRQIIEQAQERLRYEGRGTILFCDEIHRFNRAQQDAFLPWVEQGVITLIGATTENPSFELTSALLSRVHVYVLEPLAPEHLRALIGRALAAVARERGPRGRLPGGTPPAPPPGGAAGGTPLAAGPVASGGTGQAEGPAPSEGGEPMPQPEGAGLLAEDAIAALIAFADGDARRALNALEAVLDHLERHGAELARPVTRALVEEVLSRRLPRYDKSGEEHFNLISALHKAVRGSDPQGALYWLARMIAGGEDPLYVARRVVRMAAEDIGLADPRALSVALAAKEAYDFLGSPEGELAIAEAVVYLATAPKSNRVYEAWNQALEAARQHPAEPVPLAIRNAPTGLMKELGYGAGYRYDHAEPDAFAAGQEYLPEVLRGAKWYEPSARGYEKTLGERLAYWEQLKRQAAG
jgi:putative ATPase